MSLRAHGLMWFVAQYPPLAAMQPQQRGALYAKLPPTSEPSLLQWARSYRVELDLTPDAAQSGAAAAELIGSMQAARIG